MLKIIETRKTTPTYEERITKDENGFYYHEIRMEGDIRLERTAQSEQRREEQIMISGADTTLYVVFMRGIHDDYPTDVCSDLGEAKALISHFEDVDRKLDLFQPDRYYIRKVEISPEP